MVLIGLNMYRLCFIIKKKTLLHSMEFGRNFTYVLYSARSVDIVS
jgi:hypothetical protein